MNVNNTSSNIFIAANTKNNIISLYDNIYNSLTQHDTNGNGNKRQRTSEGFAFDITSVNEVQTPVSEKLYVKRKNQSLFTCNRFTTIS